MIFGALSGIMFFALFFVSHVVYFFFRPHSDRARVLLGFLALILFCELICIVIAFVGLNYSGLLSHGGIFMAVLWGWLTILCLFVLYMPFYLSVARSLTVESMIYIINNSQQGRCSIKQLYEEFASKSVVNGRLATMKSKGWLIYSDGVYKLTRKSVIVAKLFRFLKDLWQLGAGG